MKTPVKIALALWGSVLLALIIASAILYYTHAGTVYIECEPAKVVGADNYTTIGGTVIVEANGVTVEKPLLIKIDTGMEAISDLLAVITVWIFGGILAIVIIYVLTEGDQ